MWLTFPKLHKPRWFNNLLLVIVFNSLWHFCLIDTFGGSKGGLWGRQGQCRKAVNVTVKWARVSPKFISFKYFKQGKKVLDAKTNTPQPPAPFAKCQDPCTVAALRGIFTSSMTRFLLKPRLSRVTHMSSSSPLESSASSSLSCRKPFLVISPFSSSSLSVYIQIYWINSRQPLVQKFTMIQIIVPLTKQWNKWL